MCRIETGRPRFSSTQGVVADAAAGADAAGVAAVTAVALAAGTALAAGAGLAALAFNSARAAELAAGVCTTIGVGVRSGEFRISDGASAWLLTFSPRMGELRGTVVK